MKQSFYIKWINEYIFITLSICWIHVWIYAPACFWAYTFLDENTTWFTKYTLVWPVKVYETPNYNIQNFRKNVLVLYNTYILYNTSICTRNYKRLFYEYNVLVVYDFGQQSTFLCAYIVESEDALAYFSSSFWQPTAERPTCPESKGIFKMKLLPGFDIDFQLHQCIYDRCFQPRLDLEVRLVDSLALYWDDNLSINPTYLQVQKGCRLEKL